MALINPYQTYQQNSIITASPQELTLMLYTGSLKFMRMAKKAMLEKKFEEKNANMIKAQNIIRELQATLDPKFEISNNLADLYEFMNSKLMEANMKNDPDALAEVEALMIELRDTWKQAMGHGRP